MSKASPSSLINRAGPVIAAALLALTCLPALARDRSAAGGSNSGVPPEANPVDTEAPRGGPVWITLGAYSHASPILRYRIWRPPESGKLGTPEITTPNTARVRYEPPAGSGPGQDSFWYEVQSNAGVSAPVQVRIRITDKDPILVAPNGIDFGEVLPGESARRVLVVQNIGGGMAEGDVRLPEGWTIEGPSAYRLGAGEKQSFTLIFKPAEERSYTGDVVYTSDLGRATDLDGREVAPIAVTPGPVEIKGMGTVRVGMIQVENRTSGVRTVRVTPGPHLQADEKLEAPPRGVAEIVIRAKQGDRGEFYDHVNVEVEGEGVNVDVPVHAAPPPEIAQAPAPVPPAAAPASTAAPIAAAPPPAIQAAAAQPPPELSLPPLALGDGETAEPAPGTPVSALVIKRAGDDEAELTCNFKNAGPVRTYRLEAQTLALDPRGRIEVKWVAFAKAPLEVDGQNVVAGLKHLRPGALYVLRLIGLDDQDRIIAMSSVGQLWTPKAKPAGGWLWPTLILAALAAAAAYWRWRRKLAFPAA